MLWKSGYPESLKDILFKISKNHPVTLKERVYVENFADKDQKVSSWLKRARRLQMRLTSKNDLDELLGSLDIGSIDPDSEYVSTRDDLADFFCGAPSWLSRS